VRAACRRAAAALLSLSAAFTMAPAMATSHVFLVQNSGWMEPFYTDPASPYKALVTEVVTAVTQPGDALVLAAFNQSLPGAPSPKALLALQLDGKLDETGQRRRIAAALVPLAVAHKPGSAALADTDLGEAVNAAIESALAGKPGLVWLFTNNKNSPNNDQETARRNREFYALIHHGAAIGKALAFPLKMPVHGARYSAGGLMVYVLAIGDQGVSELDTLLRTGRLQRVITEAPARLKPLDRDTVRLTPVKVTGAPGVALSMAPAGRPGAGVLRADIDAGSTAPSAGVQWRLENAMYPYTIAAATLDARATLAGSETPLPLEGGPIRALAPGASMPLSSRLALPAGQLPGRWSARAIGAAGSALVMPGSIALRLSGQRLELSPLFRARMAELFPGDPMPEIFVPPDEVRGSLAVLPLEVRVHFGLAPLLALIAAALAALLLAVVLPFALLRPRKVRVSIDGEPLTLTTRAGRVQPLHDRSGRQVAQLKSTVFGHTLLNVREGAQVRLLA
jgi:hypothetical protein